MAFFDRKDDYHFIRWAQEVKRRDHYTCQICGRRGVELNAHHLNAWASFPDERYDLENGATLCKFHHDDFHHHFHKGNNTKEQFEEYRKIAEALIIAANYNDNLEREVNKSINFLDGYDMAKNIESLDIND